MMKYRWELLALHMVFAGLVACGGGSAGGAGSANHTGGGAATTGGSTDTGGGSDDTSGGSTGNNAQTASCAMNTTQGSYCSQSTIAGSDNDWSGTGVIYYYSGIAVQGGSYGCAAMNGTNSITPANDPHTSNTEGCRDGGGTPGTGCDPNGAAGYCVYDIRGDQSTVTISNATWH